MKHGILPNEAEEILLPYHENNKDLLEDIDDMIRNKKDISEILKVTNQKILKDNFGLSSSDIKIAENIWRKLSARRLNRGKNNHS